VYVSYFFSVRGRKEINPSPTGMCQRVLFYYALYPIGISEGFPFMFTGFSTATINKPSRRPLRLGGEYKSHGRMSKDLLPH
jgi:hypothetical protein